MKLSVHSLTGVALVMLLAPLPGARAEFIPWSYNWSRSPAEIHADAPGTSRITLTDESVRSAVGDSNIVATNLRTFSSALPGSPDRFTAKSYQLTLNLTDTASRQTGLMVFTGEIDGWVSALNSSLTNQFTGETTQSIVLGSNRYTATIGGFSPPGPPGSVNAGSIAAFVQMKVDAVVPMPEPGTLVLSALGAALLAGAHRRRRRVTR
jgi:hypothetical protein